jgi:hypothetical protein
MFRARREILRFSEPTKQELPSGAEYPTRWAATKKLACGSTRALLPRLHTAPDLAALKRSEICARGLSASNFAVLRQGALRRGNSCLNVGIVRCDGAVPAQMEGDTLQKEGSLLSRQQGVSPCHLQALRRGQKADRAA